MWAGPHGPPESPKIPANEDCETDVRKMGNWGRRDAGGKNGEGKVRNRVEKEGGTTQLDFFTSACGKADGETGEFPPESGKRDRPAGGPASPQKVENSRGRAFYRKFSCPGCF